MTQTTNSLVFVPVAGSTTTRMFPSSPQSPSVNLAQIVWEAFHIFKSSWQARKEERTGNLVSTSKEVETLYNTTL